MDCYDGRIEYDKLGGDRGVTERKMALSFSSEIKFIFFLFSGDNPLENIGVNSILTTPSLPQLRKLYLCNSYFRQKIANLTEKD